MPPKRKDYNEIELETIADLRAEGHDSFEEMAGPLRRRMAEKTGQPTRLTPWVVRFAVVVVSLAAVGLLILLTLAS
jgi:hypothetical protein